ncbi:hypothetical protein [Candidatus Cetobacterium colombiensis]|uniref:Uncharacterized protein n=1 Tax=Candidatus Cetobacterium colombiensis TaxID=3073100 RepID=A0ABU4WEX0_9FUSO|nr:hypothetical protein [Candidatus Cetobacterium colombiensis]MDX8337116.1 hypothetical protein [Candidatus Cetobacterium colombiensis]
MKNKLVKKGVNPLALIDPIQEALTIVSDTIINIKRENSITERFEIEAGVHVEKEREVTKRVIHESNVSLAKFCVECETKLKLANLDIEKLKVEIEVVAKESSETHEENMRSFELKEKILVMKFKVIDMLIDLIKELKIFEEKREVLQKLHEAVLSLS